jgi:hypothetical protein
MDEGSATQQLNIIGMRAKRQNVEVLFHSVMRMADWERACQDW